jgi:hypothetical protein
LGGDRIVGAGLDVLTADGDEGGSWGALPNHPMCNLDVLGTAGGGWTHSLEGIGRLGHNNGGDDGEGSEEKDCRL